MTDTIAQTCYYHFITQCALKLHLVLGSSIFPAQLIEYMREPQSQTNRRDKLTRSIQACEEALRLGLKHMQPF